MSYKASTVATAVAATGYFVVAGLFFVVAVASPNAPRAAPSVALVQDEAAEVQLAREAAAKRLAAMIKRSSPMVSVGAKASAS
jgi:hypothetical protein